MKRLLIVGLLMLGSVAVASAASTAATTPMRHRSMHAMKAKVSADSAKAVALAEVPGAKVSSMELEREHGKLVYSFDLKVAGKSGVEEVNVDANDAKVLSKKHETAAAERGELAKEKRAAAKPKTAAATTPAKAGR